MNDIATLANRLHRDLPLPQARTVRRSGLELPPGTIIVSADNHWDISENIFRERLPARLAAKAPEIWFDRFVRFSMPDGKGGFFDPQAGSMEPIAMASTALAGFHDMDARIADMDAEGIAKEINFPGFGLAFSHLPDFELREAMYRVYNEALAEKQAKAPGRSYGVAVVSNWWDPERAEAAVRQIVDLGFRTMVLPIQPGLNRDGRPIVYSEPEYDPLWDAIEQSGLPLCFHIGEGAWFSGRGGWGIKVWSLFSPFIPTLGQLIFGGIFDRNPKLQVVFAEAGIGWVPNALQDAELVYNCYPGLHQLIPKLSPTEYWAKHCHATFQNDALGLKLIEHIGVDKVMWAVDYPHAEGSWGISEDSIRQVLDAVSPEDAKKILGGNAIRVFGL